MPLQTIINPQLVSDLVNSLVTMADESGRHYFERWEIVNAYSGCMLGNPALSVLADAYAKGIRSYDVEKAYRYAVNSSKRFGNDPLGYTPRNCAFRTRSNTPMPTGASRAWPSSWASGKTPPCTPPKGRPTAISSTGRKAGSARAAPTERGSRGLRTPAPPSGTAASSRTPISRGGSCRTTSRAWSS